MECYNWGAPNADGYYGTCPTWSGTNDDGNLYGSVTYVGGPAGQSSLTAYTDTFTYDGLNRLATAGDSGGWSRSYNYDQFGNMWVTSPGTGPGLNSATPTSNVYNSKNQMSTATYDASGNQLTMGPYTVAYDAENHQVSEANTIGNPSASYNYDGAGRRVVRMVGAQTTVYIYDAFGALAAAYSNGAMGTPPCHTCYLTYDHLGTMRLITDPKANVIARHDFLPFGEEIPGGIAGRSASQFGPGLDNINQKFTGQERDSESLLDFFQARYFGGALGRFLSPDPRNAGASLTNPQSWNAYAYVGNNPLGAVDPSGSVACLARSPRITACGGNYGDGGGGGGGPGLDGGVSIDGGAPTDPGLFGGGGDSGFGGPGLGGGESTVACPNNACTIAGTDPITGQQTILQFTAGAGGATGYLSGYDISQGLNEVAGTFMSNTQYASWIQATYASDINSQRTLLAQAISGNSGGKVTYQEAFDALNTDQGFLKGGNYNFAITDPAISADTICNGDPRCGGGIHFSEPGFVHLDTTDPLDSPFALFEHFFVDVFLGNTAYYVIPRPWP